MKKTIFLFIVLFSTTVQAQEKIETDRPDQTETSFTVPKGWFQGEFGFNKENYKNGNYLLVHPTSLLKVGLHKRIEARIIIDLTTRREHLIPNTKSTTSLQPVIIGTKVAFTEQKGILPKTSMIAQVSLPFLSGQAALTTDAAPTVRLTMENKISDVVSLGYNVGAEWDGISSGPEWIYTFAPGFNLGEKWYAYVEAFGSVKKGEMPDHNIDAGIAYFVTKNSKLDLSGGIGLSPESIRNYVSLGFSFRFPF